MARKAGSSEKVMIQSEGIKELDAALRGLEKKLARKVIGAALRAGAKVVASTAKAEVPVKSGALKRAIRVRAGKRKQGKITIITTIGEGYFKGDTFYGGFIEYGYRRGKRTNKSKRKIESEDKREKIPANPFMQRAYDKSSQQAAAVIEKHLQQGIEQATKEAGQEAGTKGAK